MKKILVIDREEKTAEAIRQRLATANRQVCRSATAKETATLLNSEVFDLVIGNSTTPLPGFDILEWLQAHSAKTKVILIAPAGTPPSPMANVLATLSQPLDLAALESLVADNLLDNGFFGVLNDISLADYIQLICMKRATKAIRVSQQNEKGLILIRDGRLIYAAQDSLTGPEAFFTILSWKKGSFRDVKIKLFPTPNIDRDYRSLLMEATTAKKELAGTGPAATDGRAEMVEQAGDDRTGPDLSAPLPAAISAPPAPGRQKPAGGQPPATEKRTRQRRRLITMAAILPILLLAIVCGSLGLMGKLPLPAFATSKTSPANGAGTPAVAPGKAGVAMQNEQSDNRAGKASSIAIRPLGEPKTAVPLPEETILRLHGSNTIGARLAPALASAYLTAVLGAEPAEPFPGAKENEVLLKARLKDRLLVVDIQAHGSTTGFKDLEAAACDIGMASRRIQEKEVEALGALGLGDMTASANEHVIALDGIAVIVNKSNALEKIEMRQLAAIFSGQVTDWAAVGGTPGPINVYARDDNSGTYDTFKSIVLDKLKLKEGCRRFESNPELADQVARDPRGIGFTSLPNVDKAKAVAVADTGAAPIYPSFFTVATEDYPIARRLYLYTASTQPNRHVRDFVEFVHSRQGQEIVDKTDMVDMNIKPFYAEKTDPAKIVSPASVQEYLQATGNAQRLSLNFRFTSGAASLDNRGERDLVRMVDFLKDKLDRQIILAGFADNTGDYEHNRQLARIRAEAVAKELRARGIVVKGVYSAGEELPVASNLSVQGQNKNRRVEVWIR